MPKPAQAYEATRANQRSCSVGRVGNCNVRPASCFEAGWDAQPSYRCMITINLSKTDLKTRGALSKFYGGFVNHIAAGNTSVRPVGSQIEERITITTNP